MRGDLLCQAGRSNDLHKAHPIKGVGGEVEDHSKAAGGCCRRPVRPVCPVSPVSPALPAAPGSPVRQVSSSLVVYAATQSRPRPGWSSLSSSSSFSSFSRFFWIFRAHPIKGVGGQVE